MVQASPRVRAVTTKLRVRNDDQPPVPGSAKWLDAEWKRFASLIRKGSQSEVADAMTALGRQLFWLKRNSSDKDWSDLLVRARRHSLYSLLGRDPLIHQSRKRSRPIMGEAGLLDLVYGIDPVRRMETQTDLLGRRIFAASFASDRSKAIRRMRQSHAEQLILTLSQYNPTRIASIGCGHMRELELIGWNEHLPIELFLAFDKEYQNTRFIRRCELHRSLKAVTTQTWDIAHYGLVSNGVTHHDFHLIYSLGVLDGIDDHIVEKLLKKLSDHLAPGGRIYLTNSKPNTPSAVFAQVFLEQNPYARSRSDLDYILRTVRWSPEFQVGVDDTGDDEFVRVTIDRLKVC